jgi:hypothetical protein
MWIVQIWHPGAPDGGEEEYWSDGEGGRLASSYGEMLGMQRSDVGYTKLVNDDGRLPEIGFEDGPDDVRARRPASSSTASALAPSPASNGELVDTRARVSDSPERVEIARRRCRRADAGVPGRRRTEPRPRRRLAT